jgi:hypothetical protein
MRRYIRKDFPEISYWNLKMKKDFPKQTRGKGHKLKA